MTTLINRSNCTVRVPAQAHLMRVFSHKDYAEMAKYMNTLREQGYTAKVKQGDDDWLVRIRRRWYPHEDFECSSLEDALATFARVETELDTPKFSDPTVFISNYAELIAMFTKYVYPEQNGWELERSILESFLTDLRDRCPGPLERQEGNLVPARVASTKRKKEMLLPRHIPRPVDSIAWLLRPIAHVNATDIEDYIDDRLADVSSDIVDREIYLLSQVMIKAFEILCIQHHPCPLFDVKRSRYLNKRIRLLTADEVNRLFAAAREEDRLLAQKMYLDTYSAQVAAMTDVHESTRKRRLRVMYDKISSGTIAVAVIPHFETFVRLLLITGARRREALGLNWSDVDLDAATVLLPDTEDGSARALALQAPMIEALKQLPRTDERVFPLNVNQVHEAWICMVKRAQLNDLHMHDIRRGATRDTSP